MNTDSLITAHDIASMMGCDVDYVWGLVDKGIIRPITNGSGDYYFSSWAVQLFLKLHGVFEG